jgi:putative photosynthetic complex assembly protein
MNTHSQPAQRHTADQMIPVPLLRGMAALVLAALFLTGYASMTGRTPEGQPEAAPVVAERMLILQGGGAQAVTVLEPDGKQLLDLPHGGFITVVQNALETQRRRNGVDPLLPVRLVSYANGRLTLEDPETGWSVELYGFGSDNEAAWARLLPN